jgi:hypothetical protein
MIGNKKQIIWYLIKSMKFAWRVAVRSDTVNDPRLGIAGRSSVTVAYERGKSEAAKQSLKASRPEHSGCYLLLLGSSQTTQLYSERIPS